MKATKLILNERSYAQEMLLLFTCYVVSFAPPLIQNIYVRHKLKKITSHAHKYSWFYKKTWPKKPLHKPESFFSYFKKLPVAERVNMQKYGQYNKVANLPESFYKPGRTSGSTGTPFNLLYSPLGQPYKNIERLHQIIKLYLPILDEGTLLWNLRKKHRFIQLDHHLYVPDSTEYLIDFKEFHNDPLPILKEIVEFKPTVFSCFPTFGCQFADQVIAHNMQAEFEQLEYILCSGEFLTEYQENYLRSVFPNAKIKKRYANEESYWSLGRTKKNSSDYYPLHQYTYIEIVDEDGNDCPIGTPGRIVLTNLFSYTFPFVRYDSGDMGIPISKKYNLITSYKILGRTKNLQFKDNQTISSWHAELAILQHMPIIKHYQFNKTTEDTLTINLVTNRKLTMSEKNNIILNMTKYLPAVNIHIQQVAFVPNQQNSKSQRFVDTSS